MMRLFRSSAVVCLIPVEAFTRMAPPVGNLNNGAPRLTTAISTGRTNAKSLLRKDISAFFKTIQTSSSWQLHSKQDAGSEEDPSSPTSTTPESPHQRVAVVIQETLTTNPARSVAFSIIMATSGAILGPFLDSYHSAFGVLAYDAPITMQLWGVDSNHPALITAWWVPPLFALAGFLIGWLYILLDGIFGSDAIIEVPNVPSPPKILLGISMFTFQYWLSGILFSAGVDRSIILNVMSATSFFGFCVFDNSVAGFWTSTATALGGPLIEMGLLTLSANGFFHGTGYHYTDLGETGFFPLWILPVYFLGGPANGNLARGYWSALGGAFPCAKSTNAKPASCQECDNTRRSSCPNWYVIYSSDCFGIVSISKVKL